MRNFLNLKFFLILMLFLFSIELILQLTYKILNKNYLINRVNLPIFLNNEVACWKLKPLLNYTHSTNEFSYKIYTDKNSFRCLESLKKKKDENFDIKQKTILFLGSTSAFGWGVEYDKSYSYLIAEHLKSKKIINNSINASIPGQLPSLQLCWFINEGYKYKPDIIVQSVPGSLNLRIPRGEYKYKDFCKKICEKTGYYASSKGHLLSNELLRNPKFYLKNSAIVFYSWYLYVLHNSKKNTNEGKQLNKIEKYEVEKVYENFDYQYEKYVNLVQRFSNGTKVIFINIPKSYSIHREDRKRWSHQSRNFSRESVNYRYNIKNLKKKYNIIETKQYLIDNKKNKRMFHLIDASLNKNGNFHIFNAFKNYCIKNECFN